MVIGIYLEEIAKVLRGREKDRTLGRHIDLDGAFSGGGMTRTETEKGLLKMRYDCGPCDGIQQQQQGHTDSRQNAHVHADGESDDDGDDNGRQFFFIDQPKVFEYFKLEKNQDGRHDHGTQRGFWNWNKKSFLKNVY